MTTTTTARGCDLEDGCLVDVTWTAGRAGLPQPTAMTLDLSGFAAGMSRRYAMENARLASLLRAVKDAAERQPEDDTLSFSWPEGGQLACWLTCETDEHGRPDLLTIGPMQPLYPAPPFGH